MTKQRLTRALRTVVVPAIAVAALVSGKSDLLGLGNRGRYC